ncbi:MAG: hypothetical protein LUE64_05040, partial [Candidatus Gastranaerophilales bacterium]|nr:hypothetical protein [Candidatus Gastranaerophilales bacterium]
MKLNSDIDFLYKIMCEMTTVFESSKSANELVLGLKQVFKNVGGTKDLNIYIFDESSKTLKNFLKPWESLPENENTADLNKTFKELDNNPYIKTENT